MKKFLALVGFLIFALGFLDAQSHLHHSCALPVGEEEVLMQRLRQNKKSVDDWASSNFSQLMSFVPITFHVVRLDDGSEGVDWSDLFDQVCSLNDYYSQQNTNLQFYIQQINEFSSTQVFEDHFEDAGQRIMEQEKVAKTINIYVVGSAATSGQGDGITLGYFSPADDWIVVRVDEVVADGETLYHEIGHFFSLPHPFRGWDFEPYNISDHGTTVAEFSPSTGYSGSILNELQDGSNCETAGDEICDTPPDYNLATFDWGCNYVGGVKDPNGTRIDPDERNIMSYFISCPNKTFSSQQKALMGADLFNRVLAETIIFGSDPGPNTIPTPQLETPADWSDQPEFSSLDFTWSAVPGAFRYILEFDDSPSFAFGTLEVLVDGNSTTIQSDYFLANRLYYWRVRPVGTYAACTDWSDHARFFTNISTSVKEVADQVKITLQPNPWVGEGQLYLNLQSDRARDWTGQLYRTDGQRVGEALRFSTPAGAQSVPMDLQEIPSGLYFLRLEAEGEIWIERLLIY